MATKITFALLTMMLIVGTASAQTPVPVVVQAVPAAPAASQIAPAVSAAPGNSVPTALQELKTANDEFLKKQAATLQQLDELQKAVEQLKIYSKRG